MDLIRRLYDFITAPLYKRLMYEVKASMQSQIEAQMDLQTALIERVVDELTVINLQLEVYARSPSELHTYLNQLEIDEDQLPSETIQAVVAGMSQPHGLLQVMNGHGVSGLTAVRMESRYHGMNAATITRVRQMAKENETLQNELQRVQKLVETSSLAVEK